MGKINLSRVILGGILAGIVVNVSEFLLHDVVMKAQDAEVMKSLGKTMPEGGGVIAVWLVWGFAWGIAAVWLYAAMRPRFGPGPGTAARTGVAAWFFCCLLSMVAMSNMGLIALNGLELVWTLVQDVIAVIVGAWIYKEA
jgi:hypothetical protein